MTQGNLQLLNDIFVSKKPIRFNRHQNRLHLDLDWVNDDIRIDEFIVVECFAVVNPDSFTDVYNDIFLKKYVTALFKRQWGANLIKYDGVQLFGGVNLNEDNYLKMPLKNLIKLRKICNCVTNFLLI